MNGGRQPNASRQRGVTTVEVAVLGVVLMIAMLGVLEIGRAFFVINALEEATRRGARVAAVCQVNDPAIARITIFSDSSSSGPSPLVSGLATSDVDVAYLNASGNAVADPTGNYLDIAYVRVSIVGFQHRLLIPMFLQTIAFPQFSATLPRESLGVSPEGYSTC